MKKTSISSSAILSKNFHFCSFEDQSGKKISPVNHAFPDAKIFKKRFVQDESSLGLILYHKAIE